MTDHQTTIQGGPAVEVQPVRYNTFSKMDDGAFDSFITDRMGNANKLTALRMLVEDGGLGETFTALDIGCGPGQIAAMIEADMVLKGRVRYTGMDQNERALEYARERHGAGYEFVQRDLLEEGLWEGASFDVVMFHDVIEHMPHYKPALEAALEARPRVLVINTQTVCSERTEDEIRYHEKAACYMNYYAYCEFTAFLRERVGERAMTVVDFPPIVNAENDWYPVKPQKVFYVRLRD